MGASASSFNRFLFFKLPAAWWTGVRLVTLDRSQCLTRVRHRWINQNPFNSMFWAVQGMAAELSTGALVMNKIRERDVKVSMLVTHMEADFTKKAKGRITFSCQEGQKIDEVLEKAITSGEGQLMVLQSSGTDESGEEVARFYFHWSLKKRKA